MTYIQGNVIVAVLMQIRSSLTNATDFAIWYYQRKTPLNLLLFLIYLLIDGILGIVTRFCHLQVVRCIANSELLILEGGSEI